MWAVLSDIHGSLEALDAVLADIAKHPAPHANYLGDDVRPGRVRGERRACDHLDGGGPVGNETELPGFSTSTAARRLSTWVASASRGTGPDARYALIDGWEVTFRRVEYVVDATVRKIYAIPELDDFLGDRVSEGR